MKRVGKIALGIASGLVLNAGLGAPNPAGLPKPAPRNLQPVNASPEPPVSDNPYAMIAERNVFGLVPPPPPPNPEAEAEKELPKITPQGINGFLGNWQVMFKVTPAKPDPKVKEQFYTLSEGQMQDDIEVVKIDNAKSMITFINHGISQELPLAETAATGGPTPSSPGPGNSGFTPGGPAGMGGGNTSVFRFGGNSAENGGAGNNGVGSSGEAATAANGGLNFGGTAQGHIYQPPASTMSPEEAQILLAAQHLKAQQEGSAAAPLFPPSAIDNQVGIKTSVGADMERAGR